MRFIDREQELEALDEFWREPSAQLVVIYGKRRVGKTHLIKRFIQDKPSVYFLARRISEKENLSSLGKAIGQFSGDVILKQRGFEKWDEVFLYLKEQLKNKKLQRFVLVIDEFPYLVSANKGISSIFQAGWDEYLKTSSVYLILCGSSICMMEEETLAYKAPLYGRRTGQIEVRPFSYTTARQFFPNLNFEQALKFYSVAGGMPTYLLTLAGHPSLEQAIQEEIFRPEKMLYEEVEFILKEELREPRYYFSVLKAIGSHCTKVSEIINDTGLEKSALHNYLYVLEDLHLVEKQVPVTERNPQRSRKGRYYLKDPFFRFWFNYCFPYLGELELGNLTLSLTRFKESFHQVVAQSYEKVCQEVVRSYQESLFTFERVGRWWDKNDEIDVVAFNEQTNEILFGEAKWSNKLIGTNIYEELKRKAQKVEWGHGKRKEYFCLFAKKDFTASMKEIAKKEGVVLFRQDKLIG